MYAAGELEKVLDIYFKRMLLPWCGKTKKGLKKLCTIIFAWISIRQKVTYFKPVASCFQEKVFLL